MADRPPAYATGDPLITEVSIRMFASGSLKAFVDIVLLGHFVVKGCKVQESAKGLWVSMPSEKNARTGKWEDNFFPITADARARIQALVLNAFQQAAQGIAPSGAPAEPMPLGGGASASAPSATGRPSLFSVLKAHFTGQPIPQPQAPSPVAPAPVIPPFTQGAAAPGGASATPWAGAPPSAAHAAPWGSSTAVPAPAAAAQPATPWGAPAPASAPAAGSPAPFGAPGASASAPATPAPWSSAPVAPSAASPSATPAPWGSPPAGPSTPSGGGMAWGTPPGK